MPRAKKAKPKTHERTWGEGTVKEIRSGVWRAWRARVRNDDGTGSRPSKTFDGADAEARAKRWAKGTPEPTVTYVGGWLEQWYKRRAPSLRPRTRENYLLCIAACEPLARRPLAEVTEDDWQELANTLLATWARRRVGVWRSVISAALKAAVPRHLTHNPMSAVTLPKLAEKVVKAWTEEELVQLIAAAVGTANELWLRVSLGTGVRLGESRGLTWDKVDLVERTILIDEALDHMSDELGPPKNGRIRTVDFPDELVPLLTAQRARQKPSEVYVFGFGRGGKPKDPRTLRGYIVRICGKAGIRQLSPHSTRHTFATLSLDAGVALKEVSETLGHSHIGITATIYSHAVKRRRRHAANVMGALMARAVEVPSGNNGTQNGTRLVLDG